MNGHSGTTSRPCRVASSSAAAAPLPRLVNLGVGEGDPVVPAVVGRKADQALGKPKFIPARLGHVDDLGFCRITGDVLELPGRAEILDQLPLRIRLAGVSMVDEPAAVLGRELPRFELA